MRKRWLLVAGGTALAMMVGLYLFLYGPLVQKLRIQSKECRMVEDEVRQARNLIAAFKAKETEKTLISEGEVSLALEELTRQGNLAGINFVSVTPRSVEGEEGRNYRILPLEMEIESSYEVLGQFLGLMDDLHGSLFKVREFNVTPKSGDLSKLVTQLTLNLYLSEANHAR